MAVEIRYHVIRDGKEVAMYASKKEADEHDKMLDIAESLSEFIEQASNLKLDDEVVEELSIYLSKNRDEVVRLLKGAKPKKEDAPSKPAVKEDEEKKEDPSQKKKKPSNKPPIAKAS